LGAAFDLLLGILKPILFCINTDLSSRKKDAAGSSFDT
jgi:hypothetical protein